jgi:hypothetical protein
VADTDVIYLNPESGVSPNSTAGSDRRPSVSICDRAIGE